MGLPGSVGPASLGCQRVAWALVRMSWARCMGLEGRGAAGAVGWGDVVDSGGEGVGCGLCHVVLALGEWAGSSAC